MKHTLSVLVENKPGVLARVAEPFARRDMIGDLLYPVEKVHPEKAEEPFL